MRRAGVTSKAGLAAGLPSGEMRTLAIEPSGARPCTKQLRASAVGRSTILFLTELDEAFEVADRILVMSEQTIVGEHRNAGIDVERLLSEIAGQKHQQVSGS